MRITITECNGCIYYNSMYLMCTKPNSVLCPKETACRPYTTKINPYTSPMITCKCIICGNDCMDMICDECKEAIKKLKEMLNNEN